MMTGKTGRKTSAVINPYKSDPVIEIFRLFIVFIQRNTIGIKITNDEITPGTA
jgi:hypothetical protein